MVAFDAQVGGRHSAQGHRGRRVLTHGDSVSANIEGVTSIVETTNGQLAGLVEGNGDDRVHVFRGVPYAAPPVGDRRFRAPQPVGSWTGRREASRFGATAPQIASPLEAMFGGERPQTNEDCLYLNVWTPAPDDARRPVLVWIHGGAFVTGAGSVPWYGGTSFATRGGCVVVTLNYRLGALGFLHLSGAAGGDERWASSSNAGILDQVAALQWVQDNIAAFGGDPGSVTVFGESAGAMSVGTLLAMPDAKGLFSRAILQSGAARNVHDGDEATAVATLLLDTLGIERSRPERLAEVAVPDLLDAQARVLAKTWSKMIAFQPTVDGIVLPQPPLDAIAAGSAADITLLTGTNRDEMQLFAAMDAGLTNVDDHALLERATALFGADAAALALAHYRGRRPDGGAGAIWSAVLSDQVFRVPAIRLAERQAAHQPATYMYQFTWATPAFGGMLGSCHALEIPFVFNVLDAPGVQSFTGETNEAMRSLALRMHDAWTAFARTGDPSVGSLPAWPAYDTGSRSTMVLDETCVVESDPSADELAYWTAVA